MSTFERQYIGEDTWEDISEADLRKALAGNYADCDKIIAELEAGRVIRTPFAFYRNELSEPDLEPVSAIGPDVDFR